ncbi:MAG: hypothetical protein PHQ12_01890 [Chthoniobacteraceae bacterium]|nr:hypothetical protein [Chthoniobacteraceae bacterium]
MTLPALPFDIQRESLWRVLLLAVFGTYLVAAVVGAFALKWKPWKRCVPVASVLILFLPRVSCLLPRSWVHGMGLALHEISLLAFPVLVIWTFCLAWSGSQPLERVLRIASGILGGYLLWTMFQGVP